MSGLIPARAGTTPVPHHVLCLNQAHPRSRGDHLNDQGRSQCIQGSSPLARGPLGITVNLSSESGLIPARAGTTSRLAAIRLATRAHPRSRGDHKVLGASPLAVEGSSPLARGPQDAKIWVVESPGLIPARAGTTTNEIIFNFLR